MRVLAVGAHPDDLELLCAGTLARYARRGDHVNRAVATNGEVGSATLPRDEIAAIRKREAEASVALLGQRIHRRTMAGVACGMAALVCLFLPRKPWLIASAMR